MVFNSTHSQEQEWPRRTRLLTHVLILSGALNIGLLATFSYFILKEKNEAIPFELQPAETSPAMKSSSSTVRDLLSSYFHLSFGELVILLENHDGVDMGYKKRDLALACLTSFHFFNLEKALGIIPEQKQLLSFTPQGKVDTCEVLLYPALTGEQHQAIIHYLKTEKWPLTSAGLFAEIQRSHLPRDSSLIEAFGLTPEVHAITTLFTRVGIPLQRELIIELLSQGSWETIHFFTQEQKQVQDLSPSRLRTLLLNYEQQNSPLASKILAEWERGIRDPKMEPPKPPTKKVHIVRPGDTLWKIGLQHKVSVRALMEKNHLSSEKLKVGKELELP